MADTPAARPEQDGTDDQPAARPEQDAPAAGADVGRDDPPAARPEQDGTDDPPAARPEQDGTDDPPAARPEQDGCQRRRSNWWYVVALLGGIGAGLIIYFALRYDDALKARRCLYLGFVTLAPYAALVVYSLVAGVVDAPP